MPNEQEIPIDFFRGCSVSLQEIRGRIHVRFYDFQSSSLFEELSSYTGVGSIKVEGCFFLLVSLTADPGHQAASSATFTYDPNDFDDVDLSQRVLESLTLSLKLEESSVTIH